MVLFTAPASLSKSSSIRSTSSFSTCKGKYINNAANHATGERFLIPAVHFNHQLLSELNGSRTDNEDQRTCIAWVLSTSGWPAMTTVSPSASPSIRSPSAAWPRWLFSTGSASPASPAGGQIVLKTSRKNPYRHFLNSNTLIDRLREYKYTLAHHEGKFYITYHWKIKLRREYQPE